MNARRLVAIWRRVVQEIRRDRPSLALLFIAPLIITGLVAFILREGQAPSVNVVVVNPAGPAAAPIRSAFETAFAGQGASVHFVADAAVARAEVADGTASVALILPADFAATAASGGSPTIDLLTSGLDTAADAAQVGALQRAVVSAVPALIGAGGRMPTVERVTVYGSPDADAVDNLAPAIVGFFAYFFVYILTGVSFLRERTGGTLERLLATPVTRGEIVGGYLLGFGFFATIQVAILLVWALGDLHVPAIGPLPAFSIGLAIPIAGSPALAFVVVVLLALGAVSLGIFLSTFARTELQVIQFIPDRARPAVPAVRRPVSGQLAAGRAPADRGPHAAELRGRRPAPDLRQGRRARLGALALDVVVLAGVALFFATVASLTIRREVV